MSPHGTIPAEHFGRMFQTTEDPGAEPDKLVVGAPEGDALEELAEALLNAGASFENPFIPAGYTYLGQFIDHDLTFDATLPKDTSAPEDRPNLRTARFDLDSVYGAGPDGQPYFYEWDVADDQLEGTRFILTHVPHGHHRQVYDLQRNGEGRAIIADSRNDENQIVSQMHVLFQLFHNMVVDEVVKANPAWDRRAVFAEARKQVTQHYQWVVLRDYLPLVTNRHYARDLLVHRPLKPYMPQDGSIPVEFSAAAFRFGHSMIRDDYRLSDANLGRSIPLFVEDADAEDLQGQRPLDPEHRIFWSAFFYEPKSSAQESMRIDHRLAVPLRTVPDRGALIRLNLGRGVSLGLPAGGEIAEKVLKIGKLTDALWGKAVDAQGNLRWPVEHFADTGLRAKVEARTPLWFYIVRESAEDESGLHLGKVGGHIVAEVLLSAMENTPGSVLNDPAFTPSLWPTGGDWTMFLLQAYVHYRQYHDGRARWDPATSWATFQQREPTWAHFRTQPPYV